METLGVTGVAKGIHLELVNLRDLPMIHVRVFELYRIVQQPVPLEVKRQRKLQLLQRGGRELLRSLVEQARRLPMMTLAMLLPLVHQVARASSLRLQNCMGQYPAVCLPHQPHHQSVLHSLPLRPELLQLCHLRLQ